LASFTPDGRQLRYSTYFGGENSERISDVSTGKANEVYIAGDTNSLLFPTTAKAVMPFPVAWNSDQEWAGTVDHFLARMKVTPALSLTMFDTLSAAHQAVTCTVGLPAVSTTDTTVTLRSASSTVSVPATVVVPAGELFATFDATQVKGVDQSTMVNIVATANGQTAERKVIVQPAAFAKITATPTVYGGVSPVALTITLDGFAGPNGCVIPVRSYSVFLQVPKYYVIPANRTSYTFYAPTLNVPSPTNAAVRVLDSTKNDDVAVAGTVILPVTPTKVTVPTSMVAGATSTGHIYLASRAAEAGVVVYLTSSDPTNLTVPKKISIPGGAQTADFNITTNAAFSGLPRTIVVSAAANGATVNATVSLESIKLKTFTVSPSIIYSGYTAMLTVTLNGVAPSAGFPVSLTSSDPTLLAVPATVTIPAGTSTLTIPATLSSNFSAGTQKVTFKAKGGTVTIEKGIYLRTLSIASVALSPASIRSGGTTTYTVTLKAPAAVDTTVTLTSSAAGATFAGSVVVPAGATTASVTVTGGRVTKTTAIRILASLNGISRFAILTVAP